jgi:hypothetical protein
MKDDFPTSTALRRPITLTALVALWSFGALALSGGTASDEWHRLWQKNGEAFPSPKAVQVGSLGDLGRELENREWLMVQSKYHHLYYQSSTDANLVVEVYQLIDNLYEFLSQRSPATVKPPVLAFLVPGERGRSRCCFRANAMRTGANADIAFILSSLLHEETHLFNHAFLGDKSQGWWTGEFTCTYFQERARLAAEGSDIKTAFRSRLPNGPIGRLDELESYGRRASDTAFTVLFFLEESYGRARFNQFRRQCLVSSQATNGGPLPKSVFTQVFGTESQKLDQEWRAFFGWHDERQKTNSPATDPRLETKVTYATEQASVQYIVMDLARQAGLKYDWEKSMAQTDPLCRRYVRDVAIKGKPCREALEKILKPVGLRYQVEHDAIVLYRR